jgi:hypothetical protein
LKLQETVTYLTMYGSQSKIYGYPILLPETFLEGETIVIPGDCYASAVFSAGMVYRLQFYGNPGIARTEFVVTDGRQLRV